MRTAVIAGLALAFAAGSASAQRPLRADSTGHRRGEWGKDSTRGERRGRDEGRGRGDVQGRRERGAPGMDNSMLRGINLTSTQESQIQAIRDRYKPQVQALRNEMRTDFEALRTARQKGDSAGVRVAEAKLASDRQREMQLRDREVAEIRAVLTPEQRTQLDQNLAEMKARRDDARRGDARGEDRRDDERNARGRGKGKGHGAGRRGGGRRPQAAGGWR